MAHNLFPPFIFRESVLILNDTPKIHVKNLSIEDYSLLDEEPGLMIPLKLLGIFSIFPIHTLTTEEIENIENFPSIFLYPDSNICDLYDESFTINEDSFLDSREDMVILPDLPRYTLVEEYDLEAVGTSFDRQHDMYNAIDKIIASSHIANISDNARSDEELTKERIKFKYDPIRAQVADVSVSQWTHVDALLTWILIYNYDVNWLIAITLYSGCLRLADGLCNPRTRTHVCMHWLVDGFTGSLVCQYHLGSKTKPTMPF